MNRLGPACTLLFVFATFGLALALTLATTATPPVEVDLSGYGACDGKEIRVAGMSAWTQYPAPPRVAADPPLAAVEAFVGRNSIVWGAGDAGLRIFEVASVREDDDGIVVVADRALHVQGECHFTLDASFWDNFMWLFCPEREDDSYLAETLGTPGC